MGGEAILPLLYFRFLKKSGIFVKLLTHERVKQELQNKFREFIEDIYFVPDTPMQVVLDWLGRPLTRRSRTVTTSFLVHMSSGIRQRRLARELVKKFAINVVHQPIPVSPKLPSFIFDVGAPVIIGPMNGGMTYPAAFRSSATATERLFYWLGRLFAPAVNRLIPGKRKASLLLLANERSKRAVPKNVSAPTKFLVENGVDLELWHDRAPPDDTDRGKVTFVYVGALIGMKGVDYLLQAFRRTSETEDVYLNLIGDGQERKNLERLARKLGIASRVHFYGFVPHSECPDLIAGSRALILPSLYECGGAVVLEAMAMSLPVIATKWGGPEDYLTEECGILVEPTSHEEFVQRDRDLAKKMGRFGRQRVAQLFDWNSKIKTIIGHYGSLSESTSSKK